MTEVHALSRRALIGGSLGVAALTAVRPGLLGALESASDPTVLDLSTASDLLRGGGLSPVELTSAYLARIEKLEPEVNAFITITAEQALDQARVLEAELGAGRWRGPLHGIPVALKDNIDTAGIPTTAASAVIADRVPQEDAEVWRRLKDAGAILLGKLNLHEFAYGGTSSISHFGAVHNPWNLEHIPGGSSGGSAAAVAANMCCAALGTDTLASIRLPAAYCGIVGLKPTHGLVSFRRIIPDAPELDHVGPMARTVLDTALVLQAIAGYDRLDAVSIETEIPQYSGAVWQTTAGFRLGIPRTPYFETLDPEVEDAIGGAMAVLGDLTAEVREVSLPPPPDFSILLAEAYEYHRRYLDDPANHALYHPVTLARLLAAGEVKTYDYIRVRRELDLVRRAIADVFADVDLLVTPTTPGLPETIAHAQNPAEASGAEPSVRNVAPFDLYGIPAISVPCGFSRSGLPIGLQIAGPRLGEMAVLSLAHAYERATPWHERRPPL